MQDILEEIRTQSEIIDRYDDKLSAAIKAIEDRLSQFVSIRVDVPTENSEKLSFGRHDGVWRLLVEDKPLSSCSRERRVVAFSKHQIRDLLLNATTQLGNQIVIRKKAIDEADMILTAMGVSSGPEGS